MTAPAMTPQPSGDAVRHADWCISRDAYVPDEGRCNCGATGDVKMLADECDGFWADLEPGGRITIHCHSETERTRRNLRAVLREAASALRAQPPQPTGDVKELVSENEAREIRWIRDNINQLGGFSNPKVALLLSVIDRLNSRTTALEQQNKEYREAGLRLGSVAEESGLNALEQFQRAEAAEQSLRTAREALTDSRNEVKRTLDDILSARADNVLGTAHSKMDAAAQQEIGRLEAIIARCNVALTGAGEEVKADERVDFTLRGGPERDYPCAILTMIECAAYECQRQKRCRHRQ